MTDPIQESERELRPLLQRQLEVLIQTSPEELAGPLQVFVREIAQKCSLERAQLFLRPGPDSVFSCIAAWPANSESTGSPPGQIRSYQPCFVPAQPGQVDEPASMAIPFGLDEAPDGCLVLEGSAGNLALFRRPIWIRCLRDLLSHACAVLTHQEPISDAIGKLHALVRASGELNRCDSLDELYHRAVQLAVEDLGIERCGLLLFDGECFVGTYGTDSAGNVIDESVFRLAVRDVVEPDHLALLGHHRLSWVRTPHPYYHQPSDDSAQVEEDGVAITVLSSDDHSEPIGIFCNDRRTSGQPLDRVQQEIFAVYSSLVGNVIGHKRTVEALDRSRSRYALATATAKVGVWDWNFDSGEMYLDPSLKTALGYRGDELEDTIEAWHRNCLKGHRERILNAVRDHIRNNTPHYEIEYAMRHRDGSVRWFLSHASLIRKPRSGERVLVGSETDITELKTSRDALQKVETRYRALVEQLPAVSYIIDLTPTTRTTYISPQVEDILGYSCDQWLSDVDLWHQCIHPEDRPQVVSQIKVSNRTGEPFLLEYRVLGGDGRVRWVQNRASYVRDERNVLRSTHGVIVDITDVKESAAALHESEEQLRQAQRMDAIGKLAGGIAHDFNNLLTSIVGFSKLIHDELTDDNPIRQDVAEILSAGEKATDLTKQLLALGRKQMMNLQAIDLNAVVLETDQLLRRTLGEHIELVTVLGEKMTPMIGNVGAINQVVLNLALNGRDAMPDGGKLIIQTDMIPLDQEDCGNVPDMTPGTYVLLRITDTGMGMTDEIREHAFEPFFTTKEQGKGTGLGLSTVYGIVKQCRGHIELDTRPGEGTTLSMFFRHSTEKATNLTPPPDQTLHRGNETILVVEDEDRVRAITHRMLRSLGYNVILASSGPEAISLARDYKGPIDLILSDMMMPHMSGGETVQHIWKIRPGTKALFISGYAGDNLVEAGLQTLDAPLLNKPYTRQTLSSWIRRVIDTP